VFNFCLFSASVTFFSQASGFVKFLYITYIHTYIFILFLIQCLFLSGQCRYSILVSCHSRGTVGCVRCGRVRLGAVMSYPVMAMTHMRLLGIGNTNLVTCGMWLWVVGLFVAQDNPATWAQATLHCIAPKVTVHALQLADLHCYTYNSHQHDNSMHNCEQTQSQTHSIFAYNAEGLQLNFPGVECPFYRYSVYCLRQFVW